MLRWLFLLGALVAVIDPILLYYIWRATSGWTIFGIAFLFPAIVSRFSIAFLPPDSIAGHFIRLAARLLIWYPGPICKGVALLLLLPPIQRLCERWAANKFNETMASGAASMQQSGGFAFYTATAPTTVRTSGPLKQADGRVVETSAPTDFLTPGEAPPSNPPSDR